MRYLQAMLSRCLVVGAAPADIVEVFGYDPVVPVDPRDPAGQLVTLVRDFDKHHASIERNHRATLQHHLWRHRIESIRPWLLGA